MICSKKRKESVFLIIVVVVVVVVQRLRSIRSPAVKIHRWQISQLNSPFCLIQSSRDSDVKVERHIALPSGGLK